MPYLPQERQYREFAASNFVPIARDAENESDELSYVVKGHFTIFDREYPLTSNVYETIDRHALDNTDMTDVLFQFNHSGMVLSRLRNGSLQVGVDEEGGWAIADLSGCQQGRDLYEAIQNGLIDRMSFGFTIADDGFEWDEDEDGNIHSRITNVHKLFDVSAVDLPASEYTDISARSYADGLIEARDKIAAEKKAEQERLEAEAEQERLQEEERIANEARMRRMRRARALALSNI